MGLAQVSLADRYARDHGRVFLTGIQALVRLLLAQRRRDAAAGCDTAGFVSGYRGSPLGGLDRELWRSRETLSAHRVHFQPGLNEELALTAVWGTQMLGVSPGTLYAGVYGLWYGKAPGLDRAGDALKHGNAAGSAPLGGVLVVAGDDHECKSSTLPSQSEYAFLDAGVPVLNPAGVQEVLEYGLYGFALSRFAGCWSGLIALADTMDSSATVEAAQGRLRIALPEDYVPPPGGLHFRADRAPLDQEALVHHHRIEAALAFARANRLDRCVLDAPGARLGIVSTGKAYLDLRQALDDLGIDPAHADELGLRVYKVGMPWPLEPGGLREFARGLDEILVVEEKRGLLESQIRDALYAESGPRPRVVGKRDERGAPLLATTGALSPGTIALAVASRIPERLHTRRLCARLDALRRGQEALDAAASVPTRTPFYCSGCPHNRSTRLPEESRGLAGIGCHYMARWMERNTDTYSQMGGEGIQWLGQAPFTREPHVFANLGDGTYFHSGVLAVRAAVAAGVHITYKILFNDAVAMTGGQPLDGSLDVPRLTRQLAAEGVRRIAVVSDEPARYPADADFAAGVTRHPRSELDAVQRALRETPGCSVLVYDQTCAAELRRRRKRGLAPEAPRRIVINEAVCEGCGDCSVQSNCLSVEPIETEFGRKRTINQSSCNMDESCLDGLCPSFVTVTGGRPRRAGAAGAEDDAGALPDPIRSELDAPWNLVVTGVGGTGVVTLGALLGMAAHLEGKGSSVLDMTGLAQKGGAVISHVRIAARPEDIHTTRVPTGEAHALLACDPVVAASRDSVVKLDAETTCSVVNTHLAPTAEFVMHNDVRLDPASFLSLVHDRSRRLDTVDASELATRLLGDAVAANTLMLGFAFQRGLVPLSAEAIERAIELNGVAVETNRRAFRWGRRAALDPAGVAQRAGVTARTEHLARSLDEVIERRATELIRYQDEALARRYRAAVVAVREAEARVAPTSRALAEAVARSYYALLARKDEYEVARLYTDGRFEAQLAGEFEGDFRVQLHLAPPLFARRDPVTGRPRKRSYGRWMFWAMKALARCKGLRDTRFDPFGHTRERRSDRERIARFERTLRVLLASLSAGNHALAVRIAALPQEIRGFGSVREGNAARVEAEQGLLLDRFLKHEHQPAPDELEP
jgi:indolepyruvate ferredoxin oxidoreductase